MKIDQVQDPRQAGDLIFTPIHNGNAADPLERGDVVEWELAATADVPGRSVVDGTADDPLVAGVVIGAGFDHSDIPAGDYGLMQVGGFCDFITTDGSVDAGEVLVAAAAGVAKGAADGVGRMGVALAADSSTTLTSAILKGLI